MKRRFSVRTVCSLVCELSQSRSGPSTCLACQNCFGVNIPSPLEIKFKRKFKNVNQKYLK